MHLSNPKIPKELDADVALAVVVPHLEKMAATKLLCKYAFMGTSQRTAVGDELTLKVKNRAGVQPKLEVGLKRDSLYHILPEYLFHPMDCYRGTNGNADEFDKRYKEQQEQQNKALQYFEFFDSGFQKLRIEYQQWINRNVFEGNQFLANFIADGREVDLSNPFIKAVFQCISWLKDFRGNDEFIRIALQYAFRGQVEIKKVSVEITEPISDNVPTSLGQILNELYCGPTFVVGKSVWKVFYQTELITITQLKTNKRQIQEFCDFFSLWFLPVETGLDIQFGDRQAAPILTSNEDSKGIFLNYSTQLI